MLIGRGLVHALPQGPGLDLLAVEVLLDRLPGSVGEFDGVEPLCAFAVVGLGHEVDCGVLTEEFAVPTGDFSFFCEEVGELFELGDSDGGEEIDESVVVSDFVVNEFDGVDFGCGGEMLCAFGKVEVVSGDHAPSAGGDELVAVEAECGHVTD